MDVGQLLKAWEEDVPAVREALLLALGEDTRGIYGPGVENLVRNTPELMLDLLVVIGIHFLAHSDEAVRTPRDRRLLHEYYPELFARLVLLKPRDSSRDVQMLSDLSIPTTAVLAHALRTSYEMGTLYSPP